MRNNIIRKIFQRTLVGWSAGLASVAVLACIDVSNGQRALWGGLWRGVERVWGGREGSLGRCRVRHAAKAVDAIYVSSP